MRPPRRPHAWQVYERRGVRVAGHESVVLTAREIGGLGLLPEHAKRDLSPIIMIVERSFFGDRDVDEDGWKAARGSYQNFAFGADWE